MSTTILLDPKPAISEARPEPAQSIVLESVRFGWSGPDQTDLKIDNLRIRAGERLFMEGPSGSGKSTLLSLLAGVATPQEGSVTVLGQRIGELGASRRDRFRADHIGYIFQMFNLIPYLSVIDNVTLPLRFSPRRRKRLSDPAEEAKRLLAHLGMGDLLSRPVTELSVGQQQRVAAARALIGSPEIVLADEPTSSLDRVNSEKFIQLLFEECDRDRTTLVFVSHDHTLAQLFDRSITLRDGHESTSTEE
jgi:putative ABC transport system ATP-binding protein